MKHMVAVTVLFLVVLSGCSQDPTTLADTSRPFAVIPVSPPTPPPPPPPPPPPTAYYVAVNGDSANTGLDPSHPWPLQYALKGAGGRLHGGDNVTVLEGKYVGRFTASASGASNSSPIAFHGKGRAIIYDTSLDPSSSILKVTGQYLEFWDLEIADSALDVPRIHSRPDLVWNLGSHNKYISLILHDGEVGFLNESGQGVSAVDVEIVGCISYNNGRQQPDTGGIGHGFYIKGEGADWVGVRYTVAFNNYGYGIHAYTDPGHGLSKLTFEGNVGFNNGSVSVDASGMPELDPNFLLGGYAIASQDSVRNQKGYFLARASPKRTKRRSRLRRNHSAQPRRSGNRFNYRRRKSAAGSPRLEFCCCD